MDKKRERGSNFTSTEIDLLMKCVLQEIKLVENRQTDGATLREKQEGWKRVATLFQGANSETSRRDVSSIKTKYDNIKRNLKKKISHLKRTIRDTGGGPPTDIKLTWYEEQLYSELQLGIEGLAPVGDSDAAEEEPPRDLTNKLYNEENKENSDLEQSQYVIVDFEKVQPGPSKLDMGTTNLSVEHTIAERDKEPPSHSHIKTVNTKRWNLKKRKQSVTFDEKQTTIHAFQDLAKHKTDLAGIQKGCYETEQKLKDEEVNRRREDWEIKKRILELDLKIKQEQLNEIVTDKKRKEAAHAELHTIALEEGRLKIEILKCDLHSKLKKL